jgi:hypothetical protein
MLLLTSSSLGHTAGVLMVMAPWRASVAKAHACVLAKWSHTGKRGHSTGKCAQGMCAHILYSKCAHGTLPWRRAAMSRPLRAHNGGGTYFDCHFDCRTRLAWKTYGKGIPLTPKTATTMPEKRGLAMAATELAGERPTMSGICHAHEGYRRMFGIATAWFAGYIALSMSWTLTSPDSRWIVKRLATQRHRQPATPANTCTESNPNHLDVYINNASSLALCHVRAIAPSFVSSWRAFSSVSLCNLQLRAASTEAQLKFCQ